MCLGIDSHSPEWGRERVNAEPLRLRAGPLTMFFEPATVFLRRICLGEAEVIRGIYAAVRDRNWGTAQPRISNLKPEITEDSFTLVFDAECRQEEIHFRWHGEVTGTPDGTVTFRFDGEALASFQRNRIGLCVLHPIRECAGARARQTRTDGSVVECRFPDIIEPQVFGRSSFHDLRAVAHEVASGVWAEVEFEGEVFEMEDQRNWTDASFKTYCTPLALPFPVEIRAGTRVRQSITLRLRGAQAACLLGTSAMAWGHGCVPSGRAGGGESRLETAGPARSEVILSVPTAQPLPLPRLGLGLASHGGPLTDAELERLRSLPLAHLRVDVRLAAADWPAVWERAAREAGQLGVGIELALHLPPAGEVDVSEFRRRLRAQPVSLARVLALREGEAATTPRTLNVARQAVAGCDAPVGAGSDANFCELNREQALGRLATAEADFVFWSINPQVHATDAWSVVETLEAQPATVRSARALAGNKPLVVSPVTLKQRFNPVATGPEPAAPPGELPRQVDPRQRSLFGAAWTLGSLAALATAGVDSVTFYETTGWRGVMETKAGSPLPQHFPSLAGEVFPVFHLFAAMTGFDRAAALAHDSRRAALALFNSAGGCRLLLANLTTEPLEIKLGRGGSAVRARLLEETNLLPVTRQSKDSPAQVWHVPVPPSGWGAFVLKANVFACLDLQ